MTVVCFALIALAITLGAVAAEIWYRGYRHGFREATDEMRVHLDTALKMRQVTISSDLSRDPGTAELMRTMRAQAAHPAGKGGK